MSHLTRPTSGADYRRLGAAEPWRPTPATRKFATLIDFVATLPFEEMGRIYIMYDAAPRAVARPVSEFCAMGLMRLRSITSKRPPREPERRLQQ